MRRKTEGFRPRQLNHTNTVVLTFNWDETMAKSSEAFWWSLFSAGGVMAALFIPAFIIVTGFVLPTAAGAPGGDPEALYQRLHDAVAWWPLRIILFGVMFLSFFHCAHRVRHTLMDLGLRRFERLLMPVCYLGALAGTIATGMILVQM